MTSLFDEILAPVDRDVFKLESFVTSRVKPTRPKMVRQAKRPAG